MKNVKLMRFFVSGLVMVLLGGCFSPVVVAPSKNGDSAVDMLPQAGSPDDPFPFEIWIGKKDDARAIASLEAARIKNSGIRNIVQLIVVDDATKNIVGFDEIRRSNDSHSFADISLDSLAFGRSYSFLLLMGYWERSGTTSQGNYAYDETRTPTLLAAGLIANKTIVESGRIPVTMWPLVVDTTFTAGSQTVEAVIGQGGASLLPVNWAVEWRVKRNSADTNGFEDLIRAQKVINASLNELQVKSKQVIVQGTSTAISNSISGPITVDIGSYTSGFAKIGESSSVQFNLEYVPFNLTDGSKWTAFNAKSAFNLNGKAPVWIIRNGINDLAQDANTDFTAFAPGSSSNAKNANGAVYFRVAPGTPDSTLKVKDGQVLGPMSGNPSKPTIQFETEGYSGTAEVYYAVINAGASPPSYSDYKNNSLGSLGTGVHKKEVDLGNTSDRDVYLILFQDGKVGVPYVIKTSGGLDIGYTWGV
jgi:hypothetical protein